MADRKNKLGLSVAIGAGVGAALGVALHHLPFWLSLGCVGFCLLILDKNAPCDAPLRLAAADQTWRFVLPHWL
jgi:hypothetical protein